MSGVHRHVGITIGTSLNPQRSDGPRVVDDTEIVCFIQHFDFSPPSIYSSPIPTPGRIVLLLLSTISWCSFRAILPIPFPLKDQILSLTGLHILNGLWGNEKGVAHGEPPLRKEVRNDCAVYPTQLLHISAIRPHVLSFGSITKPDYFLKSVYILV